MPCDTVGDELLTGQPPLRFHVLSDLHLETAPFTPPAVEADVLVLAGDIWNGTQAVDWAKRAAWAQPERPILYVAGNHEFYGHAFPSLIDEMRAAADGSPVQILENDEVVIGGVRVLGCSLWSDFCFAGAERQRAAMSLCGTVVTDYRAARGADGVAKLTPAETLARHEESRAWLTERLATPFAGPTVVITHHSPIVRKRPAARLMQLVAGAFATDLSSMMGADRVALWIFGHTHTPADVRVDGTRVVSNPRGYPRESIPAFDPAAVYEVGL